MTESSAHGQYMNEGTPKRTNIEDHTVLCEKCGRNVQPDDRFCGQCGAALSLSHKAQPRETEPGSVLPSPQPQEYEFAKKGSRLLGTEIYVQAQKSKQKQHGTPKKSRRREAYTSGFPAFLVGVVAAFIFHSGRFLLRKATLHANK